jgi:hypothetical protein
MFLPDVIDVRYLGGYRLWLAFRDGVAGEVDLQPHVEFAGVFSPLQDLRYFAQVRVDPEAGTIVWPNDADLDPVVLYSWVTQRDIQGILAEHSPSKQRR